MRVEGVGVSKHSAKHIRWHKRYFLILLQIISAISPLWGEKTDQSWLPLLSRQILTTFLEALFFNWIWSWCLFWEIYASPPFTRSAPAPFSEFHAIKNKHTCIYLGHGARGVHTSSSSSSFLPFLLFSLCLDCGYAHVMTDCRNASSVPIRIVNKHLLLRKNGSATSSSPYRSFLRWE